MNAYANVAIPQRQSSERPKLKSYNSQKLGDIIQLQHVPTAIVEGISLASLVFPFRVNDYVLDQLIDWADVPEDPIFRLIFPHADMLREEDQARLQELLRGGASRQVIEREAMQIRNEMNPHSSQQLANVPVFRGSVLSGIQHKYSETVLCFPKQGQTCHSYCSFCFRWPQFVESAAPRFELAEPTFLHAYLREHPEASDLLLTGGDPMTMSARRLRMWLEPLLAPDLVHVKTIRIGTKALTYWPYRFLTDPDADELLALFKQLSDSGKHLAVMAHINHWREMTPEPFEEAVGRLRSVGAIVRSQSPVLRHVNDEASVWKRLWKDQVRLGVAPYYMFVERDTGASQYFGISLVRAFEIYREANSTLSGLGRTARGPIMSTAAGKVQLLGTTFVGERKVFVLSFLQARRREWLYLPFTAAFSETAQWFDDLRPSDGKEAFFFEHEFRQILSERSASMTHLTEERKLA